MAIANPILATWDTDGVLRTYEFSAGIFVQINSLGGFTYNAPSGPGEAGLHWNLAGTHIICARPSSEGLQNVHTVTPLAASVANGNTSYLASSGGGVYPYDRFNDVQWALSAPETTGSLNVFAIGRTDGTIQAPQGPATYGSAGYRCAAFSADGNYGIFGDRISSGGSLVLKRTGFYSGGRYPIWAVIGSAPAITLNVELAAFCATGLTFVMVDKLNAKAKVGNIDPAGTGTMTFTHDLILPPGTPHRIRMCRDGRRCAISALSGGVYTTYVYERRGVYWVRVQTVNNFGKLLEFSIDGYLLIDCGLRAAYRFDGQNYALLAGAMANLTTIVGAAALDNGRGDKDGQTQIYAEGLKKLVDGTIDLSSLKITLLKNTATFVEGDTTLAQVTGSGAHEVTGGQWPAGGVALTGVARAGSFWLTADEVTRIIVDSGFSTRYAVVYDTANGNLPIIWIDFLDDRAIAEDTQLTINFRDGKLVVYDR